MGDAGKSVLAAALAHLPDVRPSFRDGVHWVKVGRAAALLDVIKRVGLH